MDGMDLNFIKVFRTRPSVNSVNLDNLVIPLGLPFGKRRQPRKRLLRLQHRPRRREHQLTHARMHRIKRQRPRAQLRERQPHPQIARPQSSVSPRTATTTAPATPPAPATLRTHPLRSAPSVSPEQTAPSPSTTPASYPAPHSPPTSPAATSSQTQPPPHPAPATPARAWRHPRKSRSHQKGEA